MSEPENRGLSLTDQIRKVIRESEVPHSYICRILTIDPTALKKFPAGEKEVWSSKLDRLALMFGLGLTVPDFLKNPPSSPPEGQGEVEVVAAGEESGVAA